MTGPLTEALLSTPGGKLMLVAACGQAFAARSMIVADASDALTDAELDAALQLFAKVGNRLEVMARNLAAIEAQAECLSLSVALRNLLCGDDETEDDDA